MSTGLGPFLKERGESWLASRSKKSGRGRTRGKRRKMKNILVSPVVVRLDSSPDSELDKVEREEPDLDI